MTPSDLSLPTKACHNCRRKRWKCDRSLPVCQKCISSGSECLGYGKLFVWNDGVASRGKMMGKSFEERMSANMSNTPISTQKETQTHTLACSFKNRPDIEARSDGVPQTSNPLPLEVVKYKELVRFTKTEIPAPNEYNHMSLISFAIHWSSANRADIL